MNLYRSCKYRTGTTLFGMQRTNERTNERAGGSGFSSVNDMERTGVRNRRYVPRRRCASPFSCSPDEKIKFVLYDSFFLSSLCPTDPRISHFVNWPTRTKDADVRASRGLSLIRPKGYTTPDGHVSAGRTGIHEDGQGSNRGARPYLERRDGEAMGYGEMSGRTDPTGKKSPSALDRDSLCEFIEPRIPQSRNRKLLPIFIYSL